MSSNENTSDARVSMSNNENAPNARVLRDDELDAVTGGFELENCLISAY